MEPLKDESERAEVRKEALSSVMDLISAEIAKLQEKQRDQAFSGTRHKVISKLKAINHRIKGMM